MSHVGPPGETRSGRQGEGTCLAGCYARVNTLRMTSRGVVIPCLALSITSRRMVIMPPRKAYALISEADAPWLIKPLIWSVTSITSNTPILPAKPEREHILQPRPA